jgi:hypothetical protein
MLATPGIDAELADALTELLIGQLAGRGGLSIVGKEEFQAQLGQTEARSLECIGSAACLGRVGVELQVDQVIAGTVGQMRDGWVYNLNRIDIESGELVGRAFERVSGSVGDLAASIENAVPGLFTEQEPQTSLHLATSVVGAVVFVDGTRIGVTERGPMRLAGLRPGSHRVRVEASGYESWERRIELGANETLRLEAVLEVTAEAAEVRSPRRISSLLWVGLAGAGVSGIVAAVFGSRSQLDIESENLTRQEALSQVNAQERDALVAHISLGAVGVGAVVAITGLLLSESGHDSAEEGRARLNVGAGFAELSYRGVF